MALTLLVTKRRVAHVPGCIRLTSGAHPAITEVWDGTGTIRPCRSCMFPSQGRRQRPLPCPKCRQKIAMPCEHTGVMVAIGCRGTDRAPHVKHKWSYPDLAFEKVWLRSLLDSK